MKKFLNASKLRQIAAFVLAGHLLFIGVFCIKYALVFRKPLPKDTLKIQHVRLSSPKPQKQQAPKKVVKKALPVKKSAPLKKTVSTPKKQKDDLKQLAHALEKIAAPPKEHESPFQLDIPEAPNLETVPKRPPSTFDYETIVVETLRSHLNLPEYGEVRLQIVLNARGSIQKIDIIKAQSAKNAQFLTREIPLLSFPPFETFGIKNKSLSFTITFESL